MDSQFSNPVMEYLVMVDGSWRGGKREGNVPNWR